MKTKLYLEFLDEKEQTTRIIINDPKEDIDSETIRASMNSIIRSDALHNKGADLVEISKAYEIEERRTDYLGEE